MTYNFACKSLSNLKTENIIKTLHFEDDGFDCPAVIHAETDEEFLTQAAEHAKKVHGLSVTPELAEQIKGLIKEEE